MIKVILEFPSADAAIVALAKLTSVAPANGALVQRAPVAASSAADRPAATELKPDRQRGPRSDKGKARGSYKNVVAARAEASPQEGDLAQATAAATTPETAVAPPEVSSGGNQPPATPASVAGAGAAVPSADSAQKALEAVFAKSGLPKAQEVLSRFGVTRLRDLLPEQRAEFIAFAGEAAK